MNTTEIPPHQQRVIDEKEALDAKLFALDAFISGSAIFQGLPEDEQHRLTRQSGYMEAYSEVLGERIAAF